LAYIAGKYQYHDHDSNPQGALTRIGKKMRRVMQAHTRQASVYNVHTKNTRQSGILRVHPTVGKSPRLQGQALFKPDENGRRNAIRSQPSRMHAVSDTTDVSAEADVDLFRWLYVSCGASPSDIKVHIADTGSPAGRGLVAKEDIMADEVILSLPLDAVLAEPSFIASPNNAREELPWSARMALRIVEGLSDATTEGAAREAAKRPWLQMLPKVDTPPFQFTEGELAELEDPHTIAEAEALRRIGLDSCERLEATLEELGCSADDFLAAMSLCHSRCFRFGAADNVRHLMVPGVDMCNHAGERRRPRPFSSVLGTVSEQSASSQQTVRAQSAHCR